MNKDTNQFMAQIHAYSMDGLGNNFVIIDRRFNNFQLDKNKIANLSSKKVFPFDQLITIEKNNGKEYPIKIFNSDGIEVSACGNGVRCIAYLIYQEKNEKKISIKTNERVLFAEIVGKQVVKINMGKAKFNWDEIPLSKKMNAQEVKIDFLKKNFGSGFCVNVGNPHIIYFVDDCAKIDIKELGSKVENYELFPERINVTFAEVLDKKNIKINVWERGAGLTKACGTAACATAVAASKNGLVGENSIIHFKNGNLKIDYKNEIFMTGPVSDIKKIDLEI
jgi:diaminopimelate epimerase|tara:strand:- start:422 stop:1258 length:837 start_codon:yes stop_codon:yes gene_type:complete